jgi:hypothetical protein
MPVSGVGDDVVGESVGDHVGDDVVGESVGVLVAAAVANIPSMTATVTRMRLEAAHVGRVDLRKTAKGPARG